MSILVFDPNFDPDFDPDIDLDFDSAFDPDFDPDVASNGISSKGRIENQTTLSECFGATASCGN